MPSQRPNRNNSKKDEVIITESSKATLKQRIADIKIWLEDERVRYSLGAILAAVILYSFIAFVSFFFTIDSDYSLLDIGTPWKEVRSQSSNWAGPEGTLLGNWLANETFGIATLAMFVMLSMYCIKIFGLLKQENNWKIFFCNVFWLIWGSVALSFLQMLTGNEGMLIKWGGAHGEAVVGWFVSYIQIIGLVLVLIVTLTIFFIVVDPKSIEHLKQFGRWLKKLFTPKPKPIVVADPTTEVDTDEVHANEATNETNNITEEILDEGFTVNTGISDDLVDDSSLNDENKSDNEDSKDETADSRKKEKKEGENEGEDINLDINKPVETEISEDDPDYILKTQGPYDPRKDLEFYRFPALSLLKTYDNETSPIVDIEEQNANKERIVTTLRNFGIEIKSISATIGPTVTLYEIKPQDGIKIARIKNLEDDIMLSLAASGIRMIAPMPGKGTIGIEVPNQKPQVVSMHSVIASRKFQEEKKMRLPVAIGKTITNDVFMFDLAKTPHLLVAGATGQGKSVGLNAIITSLLYKKHPSELKFVLVDPKMVEFNIYEALEKHYMAAMPDYDKIIITDCTKVINTLNSLVIEMEDRYMLLMDARERNLEDYNKKFIERKLNPLKDVQDSHGGIQHHRFLPYIVIIIDEYGDFIMQAGKEVEKPIQRITQKARAVGMHMILATQRPQVSIVTGVIKANVPARIAFRTQSLIDSRTVLDAKGAEGLVGKGDMLYSGGTEITRIQCAFVDTPEVEQIVKNISEQQGYRGPYELPEYVGEGEDGEALAPGSVDLKRLDPMFKEVATYVVTKQEGSTSKLQRAFEIGYNRAGKLSDQLEAAGIVGPNKGPKGRDVLVQDMMQLAQILEQLGLN